MKRRKPDLVVVLAILIGAGVLVTSLTQAAMTGNSSGQVQLSSTAGSQVR